MSLLAFVFRHNSLLKGMGKFSLVVDAAVGHRLEDLARDMKEYAQANAPWEDRTGQARDGLDTEVVREGTKHIVYLYHTVDYGIWLEIRWSGSYAIIMPTIEHFSGEALANINLGAGSDEE